MEDVLRRMFSFYKLLTKITSKTVSPKCCKIRISFLFIFFKKKNKMKDKLAGNPDENQ